MKQFKTESKRILDLMINSIYTNKEIFLRELISNASDAIDKLKFISLTDTSVGADFKIIITLDKQNRVLIIEDNGVGMSEETLAHAFDKFYQADGQHSRGGLGLGLTLCKKIAETFGGTITCESELGVGTTFIVVIPCF